VVSARLRPPDDLLAAARAVAATRPKTSLGRTDRGSSPPSAEAPSAGAPSAEAPSAEALSAEAHFAAAHFAEALSWVLTGGEDHALAATFPPGTALPPRWRVIGQVRAEPSDRPGNGQGVLVDGQPWAGAAGWDHFAR
jgi:thiamine-monophosphate kinase